MSGKETLREISSLILSTLSQLYLRTAFMQAVCSNNMPICGHPSRNDKYWHMEHQYSDRSGWDDITVAAGTIAADQEANEIVIEVNFVQGEGEEIRGAALIDVDSNSDGDEDSQNDESEDEVN